MPRGVKHTEPVNVKPELHDISLREDSKWLAMPETVARIQSLAKMITEGKSRDTIQTYVMETFGVGDRQARAYFNSALKYLQPEQPEEYRAQMAMANIGRLEKIVENNIERAPKTAIQAISEMNKMLGLTGGNVIAMETNPEGQNKIFIKFDS